jgi:hypothetical protein
MQKSIQSDNTTINNEKENITIQTNEMTSVSAAIVEHNKTAGYHDHRSGKRRKN